MRIFLIFAATAVTTAATAADNPPHAQKPACQKTAIHQADRAGKAVPMRKLNQLPPGTAYMAVHRQIGGCDAPLTMVDYRRAPKR